MTRINTVPWCPVSVQEVSLRHYYSFRVQNIQKTPNTKCESTSYVCFSLTQRMENGKNSYFTAPIIVKIEKP